MIKQRACDKITTSGSDVCYAKRHSCVLMTNIVNIHLWKLWHVFMDHDA